MKKNILLTIFGFVILVLPEVSDAAVAPVPPGTWTSKCDWNITADTYCYDRCDGGGRYTNVWDSAKDVWVSKDMGSNACTGDCDKSRCGSCGSAPYESCSVPHGGSACGIKRFHDYDYQIQSGCGSETYCSNQSPPPDKYLCHYISVVNKWTPCVDHLQVAVSAYPPNVTWSTKQGTSCSHVPLIRACNTKPTCKITSPAAGSIFLLGSPISFVSASSDPDGDTFTHTWKRGTTLLSNQPSFVSTSLPTGTINVGLTLKDAYNATSSCATGNFYVKSLTATLTANPATSEVPPLASQLTATVTGGTATGNKSFYFDCTSDGTFDSQVVNTASNTVKAPSLCNYASGGNYIAKVKVVRGGVSIEPTANIAVGDYKTVEAALSASPKNVQNGQVSNLTATVTGGTATGDITYAFDCMNDGVADFTTTTANSSYTYSGCVYSGSVGQTFTASVKITRQGAMANPADTVSIACTPSFTDCNGREKFPIGSCNASCGEGTQSFYCLNDCGTNNVVSEPCFSSERCDKGASYKEVSP